MKLASQNFSKFVVKIGSFDHSLKYFTGSKIIIVPLTIHELKRVMKLRSASWALVTLVVYFLYKLVRTFSFSPYLLNIFLKNYTLIVGENYYQPAFNELQFLKLLRPLKRTLILKEFRSSYLGELIDYARICDIIVVANARYQTYFPDILHDKLRFIDCDIPDKTTTIPTRRSGQQLQAVCLSGRIFDNPNQLKSGNRYFLNDIVHQFSSTDFRLDIYSPVILSDENSSQPCKTSKFLTLVQQTKNVNYLGGLALPDNISQLTKYDIGLVHGPLYKDTSELLEFQKINIPNRTYEYLISGIVPLLIEQEASYFGQVLTQFNCGYIWDPAQALPIMDDIEDKKDNIQKWLDSFPSRSDFEEVIS